MNLVKKYWSGKTENQLIIERTDQPIKHRMTAKEGWKDLLRRCPDLAVTVKHQKRQRLLHRVSAVAACLVIGVSIFLAFSIYSKPKIVPGPISQQVTLVPKPSVKIELVSKDGNTLILANQQIASSEGTVQFESENCVVNVAAGQKSKIIGRSAPSISISCNTVELTAWATGYKPVPVLAQSESNTDLWYLPLPLGMEPIILEETDYDHWVEQKRDWFKQEFPWIFQLREA